MHILHIVAPSVAGGLERVVQSLAIGHSERGHRVTVGVVVVDGQDPKHFISTFDGTKVAIVTMPVRARAYAQERANTRALCERLSPTVVHTHGYRMDMIDGVAARKTGSPTVTTVHGFTGGGWKMRLYERLHRRSLRKFDAVVAVSRPLGNLLFASGVPADVLHVIPNAYDGRTESSLLTRTEARALIGLHDNTPTLGWVGRLSREKGLDVLIDALAVREDVTPTKAQRLTLVVIGDGPERAALEAQAAARGVSSMIRWCGLVPDAHRVFLAFDVFVMSSRTEGTPIALFEAMNACVPIVTTAAGGIPDVVTPDDALLVSPEQPSALASAIDTALGESGETARRVQSAHARLQSMFAPGPWIEAYEQVYAEVSAS